MADNLKIFGTTYYDVPGIKAEDENGNEKVFIRPAGTKQITTNGTADVKNYETANINVPNSFDAGDEGKVVQNGALVAQSSQNIGENGTYDTTTKNQVVVAVPNTYTVSDEGKVVSNGALVSQSSDTVTQNGVVDTTLINSLTVNVSGGGGIKVASGTFTGDSNPHISVPVGKKMPNTDFVFMVWAENGTEYPYASDTAQVELAFLVSRHFIEYDLSTDGTKTGTAQITVVSNNSGTLSNRTVRGVMVGNWTIRNGSLAYGALGNWGSTTNGFIVRDSTGFTIGLYSNNASGYLKSGITYKWELVYFGTDPTNDIVEVA